MQSSKEIKQVNQSLGKSATIGAFSGTQFAIAVSTFGFIFFIAVALGLHIVWCMLLGIWASGTALVLSGKSPHLFWSKVYPIVPVWTRGYAKYSSPQEKKKLGSKKVKISRSKSKKLNPFEDALDLTTLVRLKKDAYIAGAYMLSRKKVSETNNTLQLVFGYTCTGIHPLFNSQEQIEAIALAFENGCKEIPQKESFTFRWSSFCTDDDAKEYFLNRVKNPASTESEFLDWGQLARIQELTRTQERKRVSLTLFYASRERKIRSNPGI